MVKAQGLTDGPGGEVGDGQVLDQWMYAFVRVS
jgi:hypothetical protein